MGRIKYMGSSDIVTLEKGEDFGGRLAEPLDKDVVFHKESGHLVDTDELDLSPEAVELILSDTVRFKDVSDLKRIPANQYEKLFGGLANDTPHLVNAPAKGDDDLAQVAVKGEQGGAPAGGAPAAPVGGSTSTTASGTSKP